MKSLGRGRFGSVVVMLTLMLTLSSCATNMQTGAVGGAAAAVRHELSAV